jgi:hypothetical protein
MIIKQSSFNVKKDAWTNDLKSDDLANLVNQN